MSHLKMFYQSSSQSAVRDLFCFAMPLLLAATVAAQGASVPKWGRFQKSFESTVSYDNPAQEARLEATFVSPSGETSRIYGFWDGGNTWRIRFAPNQPGKWTYKTICSDEKNS